MSEHKNLWNYKLLKILSPGAAALALMVIASGTWPTNAQDAAYAPEFTSDKLLKIPDGKIWREWPFIGSLVTPNTLNDGNAPFPEHHMIYIDPVSWRITRKPENSAKVRCSPRS